MFPPYGNPSTISCVLGVVSKSMGTWLSIMSVRDVRPGCTDGTDEIR